MDNLVIGLSAVVILVLASLSGIPLAISITTVGLIGSIYVGGTAATFNFLGMYVSSNIASYTLTAVPLFLLMGQLISESRVSGELYDTANKWLGRLPAGLGVVTIASCAVFAACCGSSQAGAATLGRIAIPEMEKRGYSQKLSSGVVAAGGTLGILIPPSLVFLLYGIVTEQSVGKLFIAGILPGILLTLIFIATVIVWAHISKTAAPQSVEAPTWKERIRSLPGIAGIVFLFVLILGGIYVGVFTPTEAAAIGSVGAFILMVAKKRFTWQAVSTAMMDTARTTGMLYFMILGAFLFQFFVAQTQLPMRLVDVLATAGIGPYGVLGIVLLVFIILGFVMDAVSLMILLAPILVPLIQASGFDLIWFGVIMVVVIEMGFITPPVGFNLFVIKSMFPGIRTSELYAGVFPFVGAQLTCLIILIIWPQISLYLPGLM